MHVSEITEIESLIDKGFVTRRKHRDMDIYILNYTPSGTRENNWTPMMRKCRGLIVDAKYNVLYRSFDKFFNLGDDKNVGELPTDVPKIYEKLDGFLAVLYDHGGLPAIATRGSFESPMAVWATEWIQEHNVMEDFLPGFSYVFEIIDSKLSTEQGLIVDYGNRSECVLTAVINTATGNEISHIQEANRLYLSYAKVFQGTFDDAISFAAIMSGTSGEGYVCRYSNGLRIKIKANDYVRLNQLVTGMSPKRVLRDMIMMGTNEFVESISDLPTHVYNGIYDKVLKISIEAQRIQVEGRKLYKDACEYSTKEAQAKFMYRKPSAAVAFALFNGKPDSQVRKITLKLVDNRLNDIMRE